MNREYKLAGYALAAAFILFTASGVIVVSGLSSTETGPATDEPLESDVPTDNGTTNLSVTNTTQFDISVTGTSNGTVTFTNQAPACSGTSPAGMPNLTRTDMQVDQTTVTLVSDDETPLQTIERQRFAKVVWTHASDRVALSKYDHVDVRVNQYYESTAREQPLGVAGVTVRPASGCLPTVTGEINLTSETMDIHGTLPALDDLELAVTDDIGVVDNGESGLLEQLLVADEQVSYMIQNQFDDPATLNATVVEASNDGEVDLELTASGTDSRAVLVTVDLEAETVVRATVVIDIEMSDIEMNETNGTATTIAVENATTANP
ncbi:hypothetical protein [Halosimplex pelagicum]|uniref:Uncharacterized protein n=1 Tax=Halosimplex pelagicum TaxID=869886 RepID=A0A7D5PEC1_9EURY|nr:hypothetical protein [Halosimplex pelagicum]QLH81359.1 hypothetical protein HZS54_06850 [Halosimplex pelagicum]